MTRIILSRRKKKNPMGNAKSKGKVGYTIKDACEENSSTKMKDF